MKDAFENNLKQSLENFEMPYDSAAWTAMQSRLDATATTPSLEDKMKEGLNANEYPYNPAAWSAMNKRLDQGTKGGFKKWYYAAAIVGAAAITTALLWNTDSDTETPNQSKTTAKQKQSITQSSSINGTSGDGNTSDKNVVLDANGNVIATNDVNGDNSQNGVVSTNESSRNTDSNQNTVDNPSSDGQNQAGTSHSGGNDSGTTDAGGNDNSTVNSNKPAASAWKFIPPAIPETVCEGSTIQIQNENDYPIVVIYPNGLNWLGRENQVTSLNPSLAGTYKVGYLKNDRFKEQTTFVVHEQPTADMDFVDLSQKYLNGLPTIEVRATTKAASYQWEYENGTIEGVQAGLHFYDAGLHLVRLTVTDEFGCSASVEKPVNVEEDYNLMAMSAFYPTGNDLTTNTFMPYALKERNVAFKMIIVDPNDGHTLFETTDASEGWDGIDQRSGSLVALEKSYIWKVTVMNPEKGEDHVYAGTVFTMPQ
ncbi:MAG: hypothetical protein ACFHU9_02100 [Fluviicola sp.]